MTSINSPKFKTQKTAFYVLLTYILFQLSSTILLVPSIREFFLGMIDAPANEQGIVLFGWWTAVTGGIAFVVCLLFISRNKQFFNVFKGQKASISVSIGWGIIGFFLVLLGQSIGAQIESAIGVDMGSENTETIMMITRIAPIMILVTVFLGPILEELVFRRVVFGSLIQNQNFWIAGIISAIIFGIIHMDFTHILLYTITGLIFAFLYYKTQRLLTSIIAHMMLNGFVTYVQWNYDKLQQLVDTIPK